MYTQTERREDGETVELQSQGVPAALRVFWIRLRTSSVIAVQNSFISFLLTPFGVVPGELVEHPLSCGSHNAVSVCLSTTFFS